MSTASKNTSKFLMVALVASLGLGAHPAQAGLLDKIKKAAKKGESGASDAAKKVKDVFTGGAKKATETATKAASVVIKGGSVLKAVFNEGELKTLAGKLANFVTGGEAQIAIKLNEAYKA